MTILVILLVVSVVGNVWLFCSLGVMENERDRLAGRYKQALRKLELVEQRQPQPICQCEHGISVHKAGGRCQAVADYHPTYLGYALGFDKCQCRKYTGPEPLPEYFHPQEIGN